jgi:transposase-like protein
MAASDLINLPGLIDDAKCFALVRQHRWPEGACCPVGGSGAVIRDGHDNAQPCRQRYRCKTCSGCFDDLTGLDAASRHLPPGDRYAMVLAGHHQPLRV